MTFLARQAFAKQFRATPDELDMHVIYDVSHNIAKVEQHVVDGRMKTLLVHRKVLLLALLLAALLLLNNYYYYYYYYYCYYYKYYYHYYCLHILKRIWL